MDYFGLITYTILVFCAGGLIGCIATELEMLKTEKMRIQKRYEEK